MLTGALLCGAALLAPVSVSAGGGGTVDTGQERCYGTYRSITCPQSPSQPFYGQDAHYQGPQPRFRDGGNGTVLDLNTGLTWSKGVDARKVSLKEGIALAKNLTLAGHSDWRVPNIKELYSLIDFRGYTGAGSYGSAAPANAVPFINTDYFDFRYGNTAANERYIDAQWLTTTTYVSTTMFGDYTLFGVNFADGRIKGYGYYNPRRPWWSKKFYLRTVRGPLYGKNLFVDNGNGTVTDRSSGLTWMQADSGRGFSWQKALAYCENLTLAKRSDWRLPNAKELQYIVDYKRSPDTTKSPAIDPIFRTTAITNEAGKRDYPYFWTSTTHLDGPHPGGSAAYISFGRAMGQMHGRALDVHGAGCQRSDPKVGKAGLGFGPQGDARRINNYVRCVRGGKSHPQVARITIQRGRYPNKVRVLANSAPSAATGTTSVTGMGRRTGGFGSGGYSSAAGGGSAGQAGQFFVKRLDRDGDGKVSRAEFDGPPNRFDVHDLDKDGFLSASEAPHLGPRR